MPDDSLEFPVRQGINPHNGFLAGLDVAHK